MRYFPLLCSALLSVTFTSSIHTASAADKALQIKAPYNLPVKNIDFGYNDPRNKFQSCPAPKSVPPKDLEIYSVYDQNDPTRSSIDPKAEIEYKRATRGIVAYEQDLIRMSNNYMRSRAQNSAYAACVLSWLSEAAKIGAFTGEANKGGIATRQWGLATVASAYIQIQKDPFLDLRHKKIVEKWLRNIGNLVIKDYPFNSPLKSRHNNHLYWAAWSVTAASVALDDEDFFKWGIHQFKLATLQINPDGTLPLELAREGKALHYHLFAITPLVMIAETAARNGVNLYDFRQGYFHRLLKQSLKALDNPAYFESVALAPQLKGKDVKPSQLTWLEPYHSRYPSTSTKKWLKKLSPTSLRRVGGNTSLLYRK